MACKDPDRGKIRICYEVTGENPMRRFVMHGTADVDELMTALRTTLRDLAGRPGCSSLVIGVHKTGPACDHD
jgi:hypothetical protein